MTSSSRTASAAPRSRLPADRSRTLQTWVYGAMLVSLASFTVTTPVNREGGALDQAGTWLFATTGILAAVVVALRVRLDRRGAAPFAALTVGLVLQSSGDLTWSLLYRDVDVAPFPSLSDGFYLLSYPCMYASLVLLARRGASRPVRGMVVDAVIGACGMSAFALTFAYEDLLRVTAGDTLPVLVGLAYPMSDLLMLVVAAGAAAVVGLRADCQLWLLTAGVAFWAVGDSVYAVQSASGTYVEGSALDLCWSLASCFFASSAYWGLRRPQQQAPPSWWTALTVPAVSALASLLLLGAFSLSLEIHRTAVGLAVVAVLLALLRGGWTFREVSRLADARLEARTDDLTGLLNRRGFHAALDEAVRDRARGTVSVLLMDLDRFKDVNDTLGHHAGDQLLRRIGRRIATCTAEDDVLARLGGDEFAVVSRGRDEDQVQELADRIRWALDTPFVLEGITIRVGLSAGAAVADDAGDPGRLLQEADIAMYDAKRSSTSFRLYDAARDTHTRDRLEAVEQLRQALTRDELVLHYQPKVDLATGEVQGTEGLVRWQHPSRGLLPPGEFLELAEQTGLMRELTATVLELALRQVGQWRQHGRDLGVSVNVTAANLLDLAFPDKVAEALCRHDVPPHLLTLELTETTLLSDPERGPSVVRLLRDRGVRVSIDDYGTGYSSLAYLQDLAVAELKLAREFVSRAAVDSRAEAIVRTSVDLAHSLGMSVVAEGVEDAATRDCLASFGCDAAQGYLFAAPMPPLRFLAWLDERRPSVVTAPPPGPPQLVPVPTAAALRRSPVPTSLPDAVAPSPTPAAAVTPGDGTPAAGGGLRRALRRWLGVAVPLLARPLASDDHRTEFWVRHLRLGVALTVISAAFVVGYAVMADRPAAASLTALGLGVLVGVPLLLLVPMREWCRGLRGVVFFYAWSLATTALIGVACVLDGGARSPLLLLMVVPLTYAGLAYPPLGVVAIGLVMVLTEVAVLAMSADTSARNAMQIGMLVLLTAMIAWSSRNQWDLTSEQQRLTEQLQQLADTDVLTGCANRRWFDRRLSTAASGASRQDPVSICMIDLDGFKAVNDTYGHAGGDALLTWVAEGLRSQLRQRDVLARLGGDEFAALLPHTGDREAREVAERLRQTVARIGGSRRVTASVGVVTVDAATEAHVVLTAADRRMYDAKRAGGDRACA